MMPTTALSGMAVGEAAPDTPARNSTLSVPSRNTLLNASKNTAHLVVRRPSIFAPEGAGGGCAAAPPAPPTPFVPAWPFAAAWPFAPAWPYMPPAAAAFCSCSSCAPGALE